MQVHGTPQRDEGERGSTMIQFLIVVPMLLFLCFYPINSYVFQVQRNHLDNVKDRYLQEAQLEGGFTDDLWDRLLEDLQSRKFDLTKLNFGASTPVGELRRRGEPIVLQIGYPQGHSQSLIALLSLQPPDPNRLMWVSGSILSEIP